MKIRSRNKSKLSARIKNINITANINTIDTGSTVGCCATSDEADTEHFNELQDNLCEHIRYTHHLGLCLRMLMDED